MRYDGKKETSSLPPATYHILRLKDQSSFTVNGRGQEIRQAVQGLIPRTIVCLTNRSAVANYLADSEDIKGVGPVRAGKLVRLLWITIPSVLDTRPEQLSDCPGISVDLAKRIAATWKQDSAYRQLSIFLGKHDISPRWAGRILKQWDPGTAVNRIEQNPYSLTAIEGIGFNTADEMALAMGGKKDTPEERIEAACVYVVSSAVHEGNVFLHEQQLIDAIVKFVVTTWEKHRQGSRASNPSCEQGY